MWKKKRKKNLQYKTTKLVVYWEYTTNYLTSKHSVYLCSLEVYSSCITNKIFCFKLIVYSTVTLKVYLKGYFTIGQPI